MRILFGIMSAVQPAATVASLVDALGRDHPVMLHHDWSQQPDFPLRRPNLTYVERPERTGWANWGFSRGILRLVDEALARERFDYFQLLSPTCMPVRPMAEFEAHLAATGADFLIDAVRLDSDPKVLMSHGWRAFAAAGSWRHRVLRRARNWYFGSDGAVANRAGLSFPTKSLLQAPGIAGLKARMGQAITTLARKQVGFHHIFSDAYPCYVGSTWFTASRRGCEYLLAQSRDERLTDYFSRMHMGDEMFFPTIFRNSGMPCAPAPHYIARFLDARPLWLRVEDLDEVLATGSFFARKFPEEPDCEVRRRLLKHIDLKPRKVADGAAS